MPHIELNYEAAAIIGQRYGLLTIEQKSEFLGVDIDHVREVCERHGHPSDEFIAACLLKLPVRFDDLFLIIVEENTCAA